MSSSISADLVVDCTGRLSKVRDVLVQRGDDAIDQFVLNIGISYTSGLFRAPVNAAGGYTVVAVTPEARRNAAASWPA